MDPSQRSIVLVATHKEADVVLLNRDYLEDLLDAADPGTLAAIKRGEADLRAGRVYTLDEVQTKLGVKKL